MLYRAGFIASLFLVVCAFSASAQDWQAGADAAWQRTLAAGQKEESLAIAGPPELAGPMADGFLRDTGIRVDYLGTSASERSSRVGREVRSGNVTVDFAFLGSADIALVKEGFFEDEKSRLILPGVTDPKNWNDGKLKWVDNTQRYMLQTASYVSSVPIYDGNAIKPGELTQWHDLLAPKFKGKIVVFDPRSGGPGMQMAGYIGSQLGMDFLKSLYVGQEVVYSQNTRQMAEWVARGVDIVALGMLTSDYSTLARAGVTNLAAADMKDGPGTISGGFSVVLMPKKAPHPNATTVFLNWYASRPGQEAYVKALNVISRRTDVAVDPSVPAFTVPKPGVTYQDQYSEDWLLNVRTVVIAGVMQAIGGK